MGRRLTHDEIIFCKKKAMEYCEIALKKLDNVALKFNIDCKMGEIDLVGILIIPALTDVYYSVKKQIITREEAVEQQKAILNVVEIEDWGDFVWQII